MRSKGGQAGAIRSRSQARRLAGAAVFLLAYAAQAARADDYTDLSRNTFGSPGLVDMPDARMAPDGELSFGADFFKNNQRYNLGFQATPWLETSFRYSGLTHYDPTFPVYFDRSFAVKIRLLNESDLLPAVAVGVDDIIGTGVYGGEYAVASKAFGPFDATLGIGWGRLGTANTFKNPLSLLSNSFLRDRSSTTAAGGINFSTLFHGPTAGAFGGLTWHTPLSGLMVSAEYSSDAYALERRAGNFIPRSQMNIGATYQASDNISLGLGWLYGQSINGSISLHTSPTGDAFPQRIGPQPVPVHIRSSEEQREALNRMTGRPATFGAIVPSQARLVDALWRSSPGVQNVSLQGRSLAVHVAAGDPARMCQDAAQVVAGYLMAVDTVTVTRGNATARCAVTPDFLASDTIDDHEPASNHDILLARGPLTTIDAANPPRINTATARATILKESAKEQLSILALSLRGGEAIVYYANYHYFHEKDALDRLTRILMADAPPDIERFRIIATTNGIPQREFDVLRTPTERSLDQADSYSLEDDGNSSVPASMKNSILAAATRNNYPQFSWSVAPQFRQELFDPSNPFAVQFLGEANAAVTLLPGLSLQVEGEVNLYDNFNVLRPPNSALPHVRSDFLEYFTQGKNGIGQLEMDYQFRLAPTVFALARFGYLESMFAGGGGEVLWRPEGMRWSLGVDAFEVQQRAFDRLFGLRSYRAFTGHVSLYYASPWYDLNFALRTGQYLAGDHGLTVEATRRFDTGVEIGAFFTRTNVSAQQFGEGSFDKGIIIRIPLGWVTPINTQSQFNMDLRPVQRDGGQRLSGDTVLYDATRRASQVEMRQATLSDD